MKSYLIATLYALLLAFVLGTAWCLLFGFDPYISVSENIVAVYTKSSFWYGLLSWTALYAALVTFPITFLKNRATRT